MLSGISITCFVASYAVALALEASRLWFRSGARGAAMIGFAGAGIVAHTLYLGYRAATTSAAPLSSGFDWFLVAAWIMAVAYIYLTLAHRENAFGLFMLPLVLLLVGVGALFADRRPASETEAVQAWGLIHGVFLLGGIAAVAIGFAAGLMCLVQSYRLKRKLAPTPRFRLPSLEWLERAAQRATLISVALLATGFLSGIVLNLVNHRWPGGEIPWTDPIIWSSGLLLAWVVAAAVFTAVYKPARQGRKAAYLTVGSFLFLVLFIGIQLLYPSHRSESSGALPDVPAAGGSA